LAPIAQKQKKPHQRRVISKSVGVAFIAFLNRQSGHSILVILFFSAKKKKEAEKIKNQKAVSILRQSTLVIIITIRFAAD